MKYLKLVWGKWKKFAEILGSIQMTIVFSILYFLIFAPIGFVISLFTDYLAVKEDPGWIKVENHLRSLKDLREQ